jgi:hypothetical protein
MDQNKRDLSFHTVSTDSASVGKQEILHGFSTFPSVRARLAPTFITSARGYCYGTTENSVALLSGLSDALCIDPCCL